MASSRLLDTNILIYYLNGIFDEGNREIDELFRESFNISIITKIELLGWTGYRGNDEQFERARAFAGNANVFALDETIAEEAIEIRKRHSLTIPDAVIAATAKVYGFELVTNNTADFKKTGIALFNPMA
jgi:hypothetical protein